MAFIQQGPRRPRPAYRSSQDVAFSSSNFGEATSTHSSYHSSLQSSTTSTSSHATTTPDWSIVFPGRARSTHEPSLIDASHPLVPSHDGTGSFTHASGTQSASSTVYESEAQATGARTPSPPDYHDLGEEEDLFLEDYTEVGSTSSSSGRPPSLVSSVDENSYLARRYPHTASPTLDSTDNTIGISGRAISSGAAQELGSPTPSHLSFDDNIGPLPTWSWQQAGETRVLASTTPRQQSPSRLTSTHRSSIVYASDSEGDGEGHDNEDLRQDHRRTSLSAVRHCAVEDARYEDALGANPFAISAGLHPRRNARMSSASGRQDHASSILSGSQVSAGFKRRHRHQHDGDSIRSSKSRRSEAKSGLLDVISNGNRVRGRTAPSSSRLSAASTRETHNRPCKKSAVVIDGPTTSAAPCLSKKEKVAKLLGKLFDVDADVYDSLMYNEGPLALNSHDARPQDKIWHPRRAGFEHEQAELGADFDVSGSGKRWRELIDGRIVEDLEGEEDAADAGRSEKEDADVAGDEQRVEAELGDENNRAAMLSRADTSAPRALYSNTCRVADLSKGDLKSQDAIGRPTATTRGSRLCARSDSVDVNASLGQFAPDLPAMLASTTGALQGAMPYFVPFSWRLLMRLVREWRSENEDGKRDLQQQQRPALQGFGRRLSSEDVTEKINARSATSQRIAENGHHVDESNDENVARSTVDQEEEAMNVGSSGRGRSRDRKSLYDPAASGWSSCMASSGTMTTGGQTAYR